MKDTSHELMRRGGGGGLGWGWKRQTQQKIRQGTKMQSLVSVEYEQMFLPSFHTGNNRCKI